MHNRSLMAARSAAAMLMAGTLLTGCYRAKTPAPFPPPAGDGEIAVMTYNLDGFGYRDRDGQGQPDDFKPEEAITAIVDIIATAAPHIIALQEVGDDRALTILRDRLAAKSLSYPFADVVHGADPENRLALLSRFPVLERHAMTNQTFSIRDDVFPVQRGFQQVDVDLGNGKRLRIIHAHLKSKAFHVAGQTEMRRNEARLLATHARRAARADEAPPMIVLGDFSDLLPSAAMRELTEQDGKPLIPLEITDAHGDDWTCKDTGDATYVRHSFILADAFWQQRWLSEKSGVIRNRSAAKASSHRPLVAAFTLKD